MWLSYLDTILQAGLLNLDMVPIVSALFIYDNEQVLMRKLMDLGEQAIKEGHEGIVVRPLLPYYYSQHEELVFKYVRPNHVQTDKHWSNQKIERNEKVAR